MGHPTQGTETGNDVVDQKNENSTCAIRCDERSMRLNRDRKETCLSTHYADGV